MNEIIKIIENTCLKHHDSGETSVTREARLIVEALAEAGYEIKENENKSKKNRYTRNLESKLYGDIFTVDEWREAVEDGDFCNYDGCGYWVKDGMESRDEVFSTPQLDATHVAWYNK
jgi:hypothetical protein